MEKPLIYDRADWHYKGDFPNDLPPQQGGTHIGIYFAWLVNHHMESEELSMRYAGELDAIRARTLSGREFLARLRDGELAESDMNATANAFTLSYYDSDTYFKDYAEVLVGESASLYHVVDSWKNYDVMAERISERFAAWSRQQRPWWRFW